MTELLSKRLMQIPASVVEELRELADSTEGCVNLTKDDPDFGVSDTVRTAITQALNAGKTHYIPNAGVLGLRQAIIGFEKRSFGMKYSSREIIITNGATEALSTAFQGILNPGDEVILPRPCPELYEKQITFAGGVAVYMDISEDDYQIDGAKLSALMTDKTKAILLNTPNVPTGVILNEASLTAVHDAVAGKPVFVICDQSYNRMVYNAKPFPCFAAMFEDLRKQTLIVQSMTPTYAMSGFRLGYILGDEEIIKSLALIHAMTVVSVVSFTQDSGVQAVHNDYYGMLSAFESRRNFMVEKMASMGLDCPAPDAGFAFFPSIEKYNVDDVELCKRLITEANVGVLPGSAFGKPGHLCIYITRPLPELRMAMARLQSMLEKL